MVAPAGPASLLNYELIRGRNHRNLGVRNGLDSAPLPPFSILLPQPKVLSEEGNLLFGERVIAPVGIFEVEPGAKVVFLDGIEMSGDAEIDNAGELEVVGGFEIVDGTVTSDGDGVHPASVLIDTLTQSGGEIENYADWVVTDRFTLPAGSFTSEHAGTSRSPAGPS